MLLLEAGPDYGADQENWPPEVRLGLAPGKDTYSDKPGVTSTAGGYAPWAMHNWNYKA